MKKILLIIALLLSITSFAQNKKVLQGRIDSLSIVTNTLKSENTLLENENATLKATLAQIEAAIQGANKSLISETNAAQQKSNGEQPKDDVKKQCVAFTLKGEQCSRMAEVGSNYCWQHNNKQSDPQSTKPSTTKSSSSSYSGSKTIQTGSRGGQYYINSKGNKTYVKRK